MSELDAPAEEQDPRRVPVTTGEHTDERVFLIPTLIPLYDGQLVYLGAVPRPHRMSPLRGALSLRTADFALDADLLAAILPLAQRDADSTSRAVVTALINGAHAYVAATPGASVTHSRGGVAIGHTATCARFDIRPGDRLVLLCNRLAALLPDPDAIARVVADDDVQACALTLVELGHLAGGHGLWAVIAQIGPARPPRTEDAGSSGWEDLLDSLTSTLEPYDPDPDSR